MWQGCFAVRVIPNLFLFIAFSGQENKELVCV
jgi:hypothetical protein